MSPRSFLIRSSFIINQIMRDLTLRSDPSFGSFQILSLLVGECIGFSTLRQVALQAATINRPSTLQFDLFSV